MVCYSCSGPDVATSKARGKCNGLFNEFLGVVGCIFFTAVINHVPCTRFAKEGFNGDDSEFAMSALVQDNIFFDSSVDKSFQNGVRSCSGIFFAGKARNKAKRVKKDLTPPRSARVRHYVVDQSQ